MLRRKKIVIIASVVLISVLACNLAGPASVSGTSPATEAASTAPQPQGAVTEDTTSAAATALANALAATLTAMPTDTPEFTFTASLTPTPTLTPTLTFTNTPSVPMVTVSTATFCRTGPGDPYDILATLAVGVSAQVVGRSADAGFWIVLLPSKPTTPCWLWGQYATVTGNWQTLPVVTPPPSPTPAANFNVSYVEKVTCGGQYGFTFKISNNGAITWESVKIVVKDTVTSTSETHTGDSFKRYNGCTVGGEDLNLEAGEVGYVTSVLPGQFTYNPGGHAMKATITVCSKNGLAGTCLSQVVTFTA